MARAYFRRKKGDTSKRQEAPTHGTWWVDYRGADGKRRQDRTPARTKGEAERLARLLAEKAFLQAKGLAPQGPGLLTFSASAAQYRETVRHLTSFKEIDAQLRLYIDPAIGKRLLTEVTGPELDKMVASLREALAPATLKALLVRVGAVYHWAERSRLYSGSNPALDATRIKVPRRVPRVLNIEQVQALLEAAGQFRLLFLTAVLTGMRKGELCGLLWTDVDLEQGLITVSRSYDHDTTKSGAERQVPIPELLATELRASKAQATSLYVFPAPDGTMRTDDGFDVAQNFKVAMVRAGLVKGWMYRCVNRGRRRSCGFNELRPSKARARCPKCNMRLWPTGVPLDFSFKDLRSTYATSLRDLRVAQALLGHSRPEITARHYAGVTMEHLRERVEAIPLASAKRPAS